MKTRSTALFIGAIAMLGALVVLYFVARPAEKSLGGFANTPGLASEADACHEEECLCFQRAHETVCVTDAELGLLVRRTGAVCTRDESLNIAITELLEDRRMHHKTAARP